MAAMRIIPTPAPTPAPIPTFAPDESPPLLSACLPGDEGVLEADEVLLVDFDELLLLALDEELNAAKVAWKPDGSSTAVFGSVNVWVSSLLKQSHPVTV